MFPSNDLPSATADVVFQYIFSSQGSEESLLSFINAVQANAHRPLAKEVIIQNPFNPQEFLQDKRTILDVKAIDTENRIYDVEVQTVNKDSFVNRILYYWSRLYSCQIHDGEDYRELNPVLSIILTRFVLFPDLPDLHNIFNITAEKHPEYVLTEDLQIHTLELGGWKQSQISSINEPLRQWLDFFDNVNTKTEAEMKVLIPRDKGLATAYKKYHEFSRSDHLRDLAEARVKAERDRRAEIQYAIQQGTEQGMAKGVAQGMQINLIRFLQKRFPKEWTEAYRAKILSVQDTDRLGFLMDRAMDATTWEDFEKNL